MLRIRHFLARLQRGYPVSAYRNGLRDAEANKEMIGITKVPEDVKKGHFAVIAAKGGEVKRFIVELRYLADPEFLKLLEQAKEEYGFRQKGAISVPCRPEELQKILDGEVSKHADNVILL